MESRKNIADPRTRFWALSFFSILMWLLAGAAYAQSAAPASGAQNKAVQESGSSLPGADNAIDAETELEPFKGRPPARAAAPRAAARPKAAKSYKRASVRKPAARSRGMRKASRIKGAYRASAAKRPTGRARSFSRASFAKKAPKVSANRRVTPKRNVAAALKRPSKGGAKRPGPTTRAGKKTPDYLNRKFNGGKRAPANRSSRLNSAAQKIAARRAKSSCSFSGDTLVMTTEGFIPIMDIEPMKQRVWARSDETGHWDWKPVSHRYSNAYAEQVVLTIVGDNGEQQSLTSNRIHPFFVADSISADPQLILIADNDAMSGEWVEAQSLRKGDRLITANGGQATVQRVAIIEAPFTAYNLTVADYSTYFVRAPGNDNANAVWVHNQCNLYNKPNFKLQSHSKERQGAINDTVAKIRKGATGHNYQNNRGSQLPRKDAKGNPITYRSHYVAPAPGQKGRGTYRIVTGSDGRWYFTGNHYTSFQRMK